MAEVINEYLQYVQNSNTMSMLSGSNMKDEEKFVTEDNMELFHDVASYAVFDVLDEEALRAIEAEEEIETLLDETEVEEEEEDENLTSLCGHHLQHHHHHHTSSQAYKSAVFKGLLQRQHRDEIKAVHTMNELTNRVGTENKKNSEHTKKINARDLEEEMAQNLMNNPCGCEEQEKKARKSGEEDSNKAQENSLLKSMREHPPSIVSQSAYVKNLVELVSAEIEKAGCPPPTFVQRKKTLEISKREQLKVSKGPADAQKGTHHNKSHEASLIADTIIREPEDKMMARLMIYSRAFNAVILHFAALRPILLDIKRNYDSVLALRERQMTEIRFIKKDIAYKELSMTEYMADLRYEGYGEMSEMEKKTYILLRHIDTQDEVIKTMTDVLSKLECSLEEEHDLRGDADDLKRTLVQEVNELRRKVQMPIRIEEGQEEVVSTDEMNAEEEALNSDDPIILRTALQASRKNLSDAQARLTILEADYADVIPRPDFENLKQLMGELETKHNALIESYNVLSSQVQGLKDQIEKLVSEHVENEDLISNLKGKATPRPSWTKVGDHLEGGVPSWLKSIDGQSTNSIAEKAIEELTGKKISGEPEYLQPLGTALSVPKFLRYDQPVRNRYFSLREAAVVIHDIWQVRVEHLDWTRKYKEAKEDESGVYVDLPDEPPPMGTFSDYLVTYCTERCHLPPLRMERVYNLMDACKRIPERRLARFLQIANDKTDESVYHIFRNSIVTLRNVLLKKSAEENQPPGTLQRAQFIEGLQDAFATKGEDDINTLLKAASRQIAAYANWTIIKYSSFFVMTDEGLVGEFLDELNTQFERDRLKYVYEILGDLLTELGVSLQSAEREEDPAGDTDVSMIQFYSAIINVDPQITEDKIGAALSWVFAGVSTLPGLGSKGSLLVNYIKSHGKSGNSNQVEEEEEPDENDDEDFERAMKAITARDDEEDDEPQLTPKQRRNLVKQMKVTNLRSVVKRLKGGALLRTGPRYTGDRDAPDGMDKPTQEDISEKVPSENEINDEGETSALEDEEGEEEEAVPGSPEEE